MNRTNVKNTLTSTYQNYRNICNISRTNTRTHQLRNSFRSNTRHTGLTEYTFDIHSDLASSQHNNYDK